MTDNGLLGYTPAQQSAGGSQTAEVVISGHLLVEPIDMAFDSSGGAWVSDYTSNVLMRFTAAQLATTGTPVPVDTITATAGSLDHPAGLATDKSGNLWVANYIGETIVAFSPSQLAAGGGPTPLITLSPGGAHTLWGIAFDQEGGLWVGNLGPATYLGSARPRSPPAVRRRPMSRSIRPRGRRTYSSTRPRLWFLAPGTPPESVDHRSSERHPQ